MPDAFIIDACRTPRGVGKPGKGALAHLHPQHLGSTVLRALQERNGFNTADVDDVVWGTSSQVSEQSGDLGRMAVLDAGYDTKASGVTLDRFCGSGITSANIAANAIMAGMEDLPVKGFIVRKASKDHGTRSLVEGPVGEGDRVVIIEDVVTTGASALEAVDAVVALGCEVKKVIAVVDREEGGRENLEERGLRLESIFTASELLAAAK